MARNRQRAKDRKQRQRNPDDGPLDDASDEPLSPAMGGAPPEDLGSAPPIVDYDDDDDDNDPDAVAARVGVGEEVAPPVKEKPGPRVVTFLRACAAELQRVQWPDRKQVGQATAVVLGFVVIAGAFLGLADVVAQRIVNLIL